MVYEEQLKADLQFSMDSFFTEILLFHKLLVTQLHPNSWRILVAFQFVCLNNNIEPSVALFSQLYQLGTRRNEEFQYFSGKKRHKLFNRIPHRVSGSFDPLRTSWSWNIWVELRKDGVQPRRSEEEALNFLWTMAMSQKINITKAVRNTVLSWQSHLQASQARGPHPPNLPSLG